MGKVLSTLSKIFNLALQERKIESNPMQFVNMLKENNARDRILSPEEKERFDAALQGDPILFKLATIAIHTGLRKRQILTIEKKHIDLKKGILQASASKGRASRPIPLNQTMIRLFSDVKDDGRIFPFKDFRKRWNNAMGKENANIKDFHFHDLRHMHATMLVQRGVSPALVQMLFAHSDKSITERYINEEMELMRTAVNVLDDVQELGEIQ